MSSQNFKLKRFEMLKLWPLKLYKVSSSLYGGNLVACPPAQPGGGGGGHFNFVCTGCVATGLEN